MKWNQIVMRVNILEGEEHCTCSLKSWIFFAFNVFVRPLDWLSGIRQIIVSLGWGVLTWVYWNRDSSSWQVHPHCLVLYLCWMVWIRRGSRAHRTSVWLYCPFQYKWLIKCRLKTSCHLLSINWLALSSSPSWVVMWGPPRKFYIRKKTMVEHNT